MCAVMYRVAKSAMKFNISYYSIVIRQLTFLGLPANGAEGRKNGGNGVGGSGGGRWSS